LNHLAAEEKVSWRLGSVIGLLIAIMLQFVNFNYRFMPLNFLGALCISKQTVNQSVNQGEKIVMGMGLKVPE